MGDKNDITENPEVNTEEETVLGKRDEVPGSEDPAKLEMIKTEQLNKGDNSNMLIDLNDEKSETTSKEENGNQDSNGILAEDSVATISEVIDAITTCSLKSEDAEDNRPNSLSSKASGEDSPLQLPLFPSEKESENLNISTDIQDFNGEVHIVSEEIQHDGVEMSSTDMMNNADETSPLVDKNAEGDDIPLPSSPVRNITEYSPPLIVSSEQNDDQNDSPTSSGQTNQNQTQESPIHVFPHNFPENTHLISFMQDSPIHSPERKNSTHLSPPSSPEKSPIISPRTPLSGVATDQDESFDSYFSDTDGDTSLAVQELVNHVIDKAIDIVQDREVNAHKEGDDEEVENNERVNSNDDDDDDNENNIFLQRPHGSDDDGDAVVQDNNDASDGSRISHHFVQNNENREEICFQNGGTPVFQENYSDRNCIFEHNMHDNDNREETSSKNGGTPVFQENVSDKNCIFEHNMHDNDNHEETSSKNGGTPVFQENVSAEKSRHQNSVFVTPGTGNDGGYEDGEDDDDEEHSVVIDEEAHPGYPLVYGNYKVCRQVSPGIKECLILETGEHIKYDKTQKRSDSSPVVSPVVSPTKSECSVESPIIQDEKKPVFKITKNFTENGFCNPNLRVHTEDANTEHTNFDPTQTRLVEDSCVEVPQEQQMPVVAEAVDERHQNTEMDSEEQDSDEEQQLISDSQLMSNLQSSLEGTVEQQNTLDPMPKTAKYAPSYNIDNYANVRSDYFGRTGVKEYAEDYLPEYENKENIPDSRLKRRVRSSPTGRPPISPARSNHVHEQHRDRSFNSSVETEHSLLYNRHVEFQSDTVASPPSSGPVPGFNTMQEQQVSWLRMFKVLEDQHRSELHSQYAKHTNMIEQMQATMETELQKQQNNIQRRLEAHRDALTESTQDETSNLSIYGYYSNDPSNIRKSSQSKSSEKINSYLPAQKTRPPLHDGYLSDSSDIDPLEVRQRLYTNQPQEFRVADGVPEVADISDYSTLPSDSFHVKRTLEAEFNSPNTSPNRPNDSNHSQRSLLEGTRSVGGGEKLLRGGVYSTPMPISRGRSPKLTVNESRGLNETFYRPSNDVETTDPLRNINARGGDVDYNDEASAYSSTINLREKHAKHVSDLRAHYEQEIQELRSTLSSTHSNKETANERILKEDNQDLKKRCEDLTDELDDSNNHIRELEQRLQGLDSRSTEYGNRYKESQITVLTLKTRLEELHGYAKERDAMFDSLEQKSKHQTMALQDAYKIQDELQECSQRDKQMVQRILSKYDELEKEFKLLKESFISKERSLHDSRTEVSDLSKTLSRIELKNKQLVRENENLLHKAAIAMNMSSTKTSYEDSYSTPAPSTINSYQYVPSHYNNNSLQTSNLVSHSSKPKDNSKYNDYNELLQVALPKEESKNTRMSPLVKAEQELLKLQTNSNFSDNLDLKTQKTFYGSDTGYPVCSRDYATGTRIDIKGPVRNTDASLKSRSTWNKHPTGSRVGQNNITPKRSNLKAQSTDNSYAPRFDVSVKEVTVTGGGREKKKVVQIQEKRNLPRSPRENKRPSSNNLEDVKKLNGSVNETLDKVRSGEIVSRPEYENNNQTPSSISESLPTPTLTREERIKERLQMIQKQEKRYDELQVEKRHLESALNRIPIHGRVDRKSKSDKDDLENKLEKVEHELGSVRMSLRKYQVLKSSR